MNFREYLNESTKELSEKTLLKIKKLITKKYNSDEITTAGMNWTGMDDDDIAHTIMNFFMNAYNLSWYEKHGKSLIKLLNSSDEFNIKLVSINGNSKTGTIYNGDTQETLEYKTGA